MYKLLVFVFAVAGCNAGVLHHGYTAQIQSAPVIQQYVTEQHVVPQQQILSYAAAPAPLVETPFVYAAPVAPIAERKAPAMRQRQMRKQKVQQPTPESFSYQIRVQHAQQPEQIQQAEEQQEEEVNEYVAPAQQIQEVQQVQQIQPIVQHYEYQPLQTYQPIQHIQQYQQYQQIQLEEPVQPVQRARSQIRRPQKTARIQTQQRTQTKAKQVVQIPQIGDFQYTYTPVVYYFQDVNAGRPVNKRPVQPQPQPEEDEEQLEGQLETLDRFEAEEDTEEAEEDYESEVVVARVQPTQKLSRSRTATQSSPLFNINQQSYESPLLAYQSFNAGW